MLKKISLFSLFVFVNFTFAQTRYDIWPTNQIANSKGLKLDTKEEKEGRITQVSKPEIIAFLPAKEERNNIAVIILPGGGYKHLTYDLGGYQYAKWLNTLGISAFVLNYRLPTSPDLIQPEIGPLQDVQAAIKTIRKNANSWGLKIDKIGVLGTSAGGHLAAMSTNFTTDITGLKGDWSDINTQPDFAILISPVIDLGEFAHKGSRENLLGKSASEEQIKKYSMQNQVNEKTSPTLLIHAQNDTAVPVKNSLLYFDALTQNNIKSALFIFPEGGHAIGVTQPTGFTNYWKKLAEEWLSNYIK